MEKIWFISDTHFSHKRILEFCPNTRMGKDYVEHDEILIANWQKQVQPNDRVYMLGDVFFCDAVRARSIMARLPGNKHLIYGNHDSVIRNNHDLRSMFASVDNYKEIRIDDQKVIMFHFPMLEFNHCHHGSFALFGHVHGSMNTHPHVSKYRMMDVGVDSRPDGEVQDDGPMSLWGWEQVKRILSKREVLKHHNNSSM